ncbi:sugar-transfer associated ATP-grasp domain-containing protein [Flagellimonas sp.]|uniref:sugar-transfer associated ATP-grasp domain-containing protein n=1 Tax=Flagellimonas sp. TaxID=2058762 RepID=UPI003B510505
MGQLSDNLKRISVFLKDKDKKNPFLMVKEVLELWILKKSFPIHYFGRFLYRKEVQKPQDFLTMKEYFSIIHAPIHNKEEYIYLLENKLSFWLFCKENQIPTPEVFSYNMQNTFFVKGHKTRIDSKDGLIVFFSDLFVETGQSKIFIKPLAGCMGKQIFMITPENLADKIKKYGDIILQGATIHQIAVVQHPKIQEIYPNSVNTIRINTYIDNDHKPHVLVNFMRFGTGGSNVDNVSSGGFYVQINQQTEHLDKAGSQSMKFGGEVYYRHPDTGFVFEGFKIPFLNEAKVLCSELALQIPNRLIGWDIAITPLGPIIIEGNDQPGLLYGEMGYGGFAKHPLFKEMLTNIKNQ